MLLYITIYYYYYYILLLLYIIIWKYILANRTDNLLIS